MAVFIKGTTVVCEIDVKNTSGTLTAPSGTPKVNIYDAHHNQVVSSASMSTDTTGEYHYNYASSGATVFGEYTVLYKTTDTVTTIKKDTFELREAN